MEVSRTKGTIRAVPIGPNHREGRFVAVMKARAMRKPIFRTEEGVDVKVSMSNQDAARLLSKEEEVRRHLEDIKTATAALERILATEKGKSTYEIRYVADIDDYYM